MDGLLAHLSVKRIELSLELVIQLSIHLTMVLLSQTAYPVESGLQSIFQEKNNTDSSSIFFFLQNTKLYNDFKQWDEKNNATLWLLGFSVVWSFKTCALTFVKIKSETKQFFPFFPKVILGIRYLFIYLIRVGCNVSYFAPYLGLLGIMDHYQGETIPLAYDSFKSLNDTDDKRYHYWNPFENEFQSIPAAQLFRSDYSKKTTYPGVPSTQNYTVISVGTAYALFGVLCLVYALIITLIKACISKDFKSSSSHWEKLRHILGQSMSLLNSFNHKTYWSDLPIRFMVKHFYRSIYQ